MKILFLILICLHGLLHVPGFLKGWGIAKVSSLKLAISRSWGLLWLTAACLLVLAGVLFFIDHRYWWLVGLIAIIISQLLIVLHWKDACYGTILNFIVLLGVIAGYGDMVFRNWVEENREQLFSTSPYNEKKVTRKSLSELPYPVKNWLKNSGTVGQVAPNALKLRQEGRLKTEPESSWKPFEADQWINTAEPGFLWVADIQMFPGFRIYGKDWLYQGKGNMMIYSNLLGSFMNEVGQEIDEGSMLRYLAEMVWYPSAALRNYMRWEGLDSNSAKGYLNYEGQQVLAIFQFSDSGDFKMLKAKRYYSRENGGTMEDWQVEVKSGGYRVVDDTKVPVDLKVTWKLKTGDFYWLDLEVTELTKIR